MIRATLDRYWEATMTHDLKKVHEFYHDDIMMEFHSPTNEFGASKTYTNSGRITPLKLLIKSCEFVEMEIYG